MFKSIQWRIAIPFIILILVSTGITGGYLISSVRNSQIDNLRFHLEEEARITAEASLPLLIQNSDLDILAKKLGQEIEARVTIIAPNGKVLGDSQENPAAMENHATRPEVKDALTSGFGESTRYSITLNEQMMYVAVPIYSQETVLGVARVALPLTAIQKSINHLTLTIILTMVGLALLTVLAAWFIARRTTGPLRQLTKATKQITAGQLGRKITLNTGDEIGQLGNAFNEMSSSLKSTMEAVSAEKAKLSTVLNNMVDGVILTDKEGIISTANRTASKLFGFEDKNVSGKSIIEVVREHEVDAVLVRCLQTSKEQSAQFESAVTKRFIRVIAAPVIDGKPSEILLLFQDLTELRNLQTMRKELVGNISHELRTPITGIKAMVETLHDGAIDDKEAAKDFLTRIESEVDRLAQTVSELTELSRIETGKAELRLEPLDLNVLVKDVIEQLQPLAERQQVTVSATLAKDLPEVLADRDRIRQTIINLVHNAVKFNRVGGNVKLYTKTNNNEVIVDISDTGIGISKDDLPHVFERFYKADRARSKSGSGLGLAIAKHTIQAHNGKIWVASEQGNGSTFSFSLPLK
ncbi:multi-sensor signal transduction histidine kinase [Dehalogenimonas lykanthroporepellens BL-DC-9]|nr:multi-sensor signal transduction histidine kinase [Dehalogenimonas lykanthroporepellens BL-DC-9]